MSETVYEVPQAIQDYLQDSGYQFPRGAMNSYINEWNAVLKARGDFWDYSTRDGERVYKQHRRSVRPARRVSNEWASLIFGDKTTISTDSEVCNEWLSSFLAADNFYGKAYLCISDAFGLGTAAWALWADTEAKRVKARRYDARMILPLSWDEEGVTECAFATQTVIGGERYDQLQMHVLRDGRYVIETVLFDDKGERVSLDGIVETLETGSEWPTFAVIKPAIDNTFVDFSPYGEAIFAENVDILQAVDLAFDAVFNEVDLAKMRIFLSDMMMEVNGGAVIPFGKDDCTVYRKVTTNEDLIREYAPAMRTEQQLAAYRLAVQAMGDACGFGSQYFDIDKAGGLRTATEVSADNSALMRNIKRHENLIGGEVAKMIHGLIALARSVLGVSLPDEGDVRISFDDSIISDTASEKAQDMAELNITMNPHEYRMKWYGEDEETARANVPGGSYPEVYA